MRKRLGFTLIELLIAIGIIAVIAAVVFVALNPANRYAKARDGKRWKDVETIASAINALLTTSEGSIPSDLNGIAAGSYFMLGSGNTVQCPITTNCPTASGNISTSFAPLPTLGCLDLSQELANQLRSIPVDPSGGNWSSVRTGYYIRKTGTSTFTVGACRPEVASYISVTR